MVSARGKKFRGADVAPIFTKIEVWRRSLASENLFLISFLFNLGFVEFLFTLFYIDLLVCFCEAYLFPP